MLKRFATLVMTTLFLANIAIPTAKAEGEFPVEKFPYKEMQIRVMPEFDYPDNWPKDQPSLLVGYYGTFENKTGKEYNGEIEFPAPVNDKNFQIYLVAEFPSDDQPEIQRPFEINKEKGVITWKPSKAIKKGATYKFVVEYYTNPYEAGDTKKFTFEYVNPADVQKLDIIMHAPLNAKEYQIEPKAVNTSKSDYGEEHYYQYTNIKKGNSVKLAVSYIKKDNESTLSLFSKQNPPDDENHSGTTATDQVTNGSTDNSKKTAEQPIIGIGGAAVIGISLIIAGLFVFLGLKGNNRSGKPTASNNKNIQKKTVVQKTVAQKTVVQKTSKKDTTDQKKKLRSLLLSGKIDDETYEQEMKKLG